MNPSTENDSSVDEVWVPWFSGSKEVTAQLTINDSFVYPAYSADMQFTRTDTASVPTLNYIINWQATT